MHRLDRASPGECGGLRRPGGTCIAPARHMRISLRILGVTLATAGALVTLSLVARGRPASAPQSQVSVTGTLDGWRLDVDGTVHLRLQVDHALEEGNKTSAPTDGMWFYTPPDRSDDLQLEQMALLILLASELHQEKSVVSVTAKKERALDGSELEKALPMESIGRL